MSGCFETGAGRVRLCSVMLQRCFWCNVLLGVMWDWDSTVVIVMVCTVLGTVQMRMGKLSRVSG